MLRVPQAKYSLLLDRHTLYSPQKRIIFLTVISIVICCIFYGLYLLVFCNNEHLHIPQFPNQVPVHNLHRALKYNKLRNISTEKKPVFQLQGRRLTPEQFKLVCYYNFLNESQKGFGLESLDPHLCTHINLAFANIVNNSIAIDEFQLKFASSVMELKKENKNLNVLLSIGGAGNDLGYINMVMNHENRKTFIKSILNLVKAYKFDGVDLDWEFPNENILPDGKQRMHFTQLLREIRNEINRQQKHKFLLSVAVAAPQFLIDSSYDIPYMNQYVDFVNLMSYDYHFYTKITPFTGINAPLYSDPSSVGYFATMNINFSANYWHLNGMDKDKIIIGLPTYGHSFTLRNMENNGIDAPASDYGKLGTNGFADFQQICWFLNKNKITPSFDNISRSPYAYKQTEWISFENTDSIGNKAQYIKENLFGGAMLYSLNSDDYQGVCSSNKQTFPLTRKVKEVLNDMEL